MPTVSVVMPNRNGADFIEEAVLSVLLQDDADSELIVVDGASTDGSLAILDRYRQHIRSMISEPDTGQAQALNKGFARASGDIMCWLNSDDILMPNALSAVSRIFSEYPDVDWIVGNTTLISEEGYLLRSQPPRSHSRIRFLCGDYRWIQQESVFWRRRLWDAAGSRIDESYQLAVDAELWLRFFRTARLVPVELGLGAFRLRDGQRSAAQLEAYHDEVMRAIRTERACGLSDSYRRFYAPALKEPLRVRTTAEAEAISPTVQAEDAAPIFFEPRAHKFQRKATAAVSPAAPSRPGLPNMKDRHKGERCVIMGNGPSLNKMDLAAFAGETVFGANAVYLLFDRIAWRPRYYACVDTRVLPDIAEDIVRMHEANPTIEMFFPKMLSIYDGTGRRLDTTTIIPPAEGRHYFNQINPDPDNLPDGAFSMDAVAGLRTPNTVTITLMQLAAYMGFEEIYLIGCDTSYRIPASVRVENNGLFLTSMADDDENHFDARYFGKGRLWHNPRVEDMIWHYEMADQVLSRAGIRVFNATVGGNLEVFPRVDHRMIFS